MAAHIFPLPFRPEPTAAAKLWCLSDHRRRTGPGIPSSLNWRRFPSVEPLPYLIPDWPCQSTAPCLKSWTNRTYHDRHQPHVSPRKPARFPAGRHATPSGARRHRRSRSVDAAGGDRGARAAGLSLRGGAHQPQRNATFHALGKSIELGSRPCGASSTQSWRLNILETGINFEIEALLIVATCIVSLRHESTAQDGAKERRLPPAIRPS